MREENEKKKGKKQAGKEKPLITEAGQEVYEAVISGNQEEITTLVENMLNSGKNALEVNEHLLIPAIQEVGRRYDQKEIFLPQMIMAAETMQRAFSVLEPHFGAHEGLSSEKILICTVKGDVHDIGKNIVSILLRGAGYKVVDLGNDISTEAIVEYIENDHIHHRHELKG